MALMFFCFLMLLGTVAEAAELVKDGKPAAVIVLSQRPTRSARFAAAELQWHVKKMTGVELPISVDIADPLAKINIGDTPAAIRAGYASSSFNEQEYLVMVKGDEIFLTGRESSDDTGMFDYGDAATFPNPWRPMGCTYAVYDFLEMLGVRWYLPSDIGTVFDTTSNLAVADCNVRRTPSMETRFSNYYSKYPAKLYVDSVTPGDAEVMDVRDVKLWHLRRRAGGKHYIINHSLGTFRNRFWNEHPEWYAKTDSSVRSWDDQLCFTNPEVIAQIAKDARDFFDGKVKGNVVMGHATPDYVSDAFTIVPMDNGRYCQCERCIKLRGSFPKTTRGIGCFSSSINSDYFFSLVNAVAQEIRKSHPDKYIATLAYSSNAYPPSFRLEDNVIVMMCLHSRHLWSKEIQANDDAIVEAWSKEYPDMKKYVWLYWCFPNLAGSRNKMYSFPGFIGDHVPDMIGNYRLNGVHGFFWELSRSVGGYMLPLYDQLELYLFTALAWNSNLSGRKLIDEFFKRYYGPAEAPMRAFYSEVESAYCNPANYPNLKGASISVIYHNPSWSLLAGEERIERLGKWMAEAKGLASEEPYKSRVELFERGLMRQIVKGKESGPSVPTQQESIPRVTVGISGAPATADWNKAVSLRLYGGLNAQKLEIPLSIQALHDGVFLYMRFSDKSGKELVTSSPDTWLNDEWELSFARQKSIPYRHLSIDASGRMSAVECTDTGTRKYDFHAATKNSSDGKQWEVLMAVRLSDIVEGGIMTGEILHCNFIRACNAKPVASWNPTYSGFHAPAQFGEFYLEK